METVTGQATFREVLGHFASGVTVVTTSCAGTVHGMTATAFASLSLEPLLVLVCVNRRARFHRLVLESKTFAITLLAEQQHELASWFASSKRPVGGDEFGRTAWRPAPVSNAPILEGGLGYLDCELSDLHSGGDHSILVGQVRDLGLLGGRTAPLLWYQGTFGRLDAAR